MKFLLLWKAYKAGKKRERMARRPRRTHSATFNAKIAFAAIASDKILTGIAQKYDVHAK